MATKTTPADSATAPLEAPAGPSFTDTIVDVLHAVIDNTVQGSNRELAAELHAALEAGDRRTLERLALDAPGVSAELDKLADGDAGSEPPA